MHVRVRMVVSANADTDAESIKTERSPEYGGFSVRFRSGIIDSTVAIDVQSTGTTKSLDRLCNVTQCNAMQYRMNPM